MVNLAGLSLNCQGTAVGSQAKSGYSQGIPAGTAIHFRPIDLKVV